jgi:hypothetical protein
MNEKDLRSTIRAKMPINTISTRCLGVIYFGSAFYSYVFGGHGKADREPVFLSTWIFQLLGERD